MTKGLLTSHGPTPPTEALIQNWIPEDDSGRSWTQFSPAPRPPTARSTNGHRIVGSGGWNDGDRWACVPVTAWGAAAPRMVATVDDSLEFEQTAWAGLQPDRYSWTAVLHRGRGGGVQRFENLIDDDHGWPTVAI